MSSGGRNRSAPTGRPLTKLLCISSRAFSAALKSYLTRRQRPSILSIGHAHISNECHPSRRNDIEERLDLAEPLEVRPEATGIGGILQAER